MTVAFAVIAVVALVYGVIAWNLLTIERDRVRNIRVKWEDCISERGTDEALIFEWSCRDLMPAWEELYPHVKHMQPHRKYSEWATFCANCPTRSSIEVELGVVL
jgi:hypothetical protein